MQTTKELRRSRKDTIVIDGIIKMQLLSPNYAKLQITSPENTEFHLERTGCPDERPVSDGAWEEPAASIDILPNGSIE